jgi:hypothetical protein
MFWYKNNFRNNLIMLFDFCFLIQKSLDDIENIIIFESLIYINVICINIT